MKYVFASLVLLFAGNAFAAGCPDFTGRFKWVDPQDGSSFIIDTITQQDCAGLVEEYDQGWGEKILHRHLLDGSKRMVESDGDFKVFETATVDASGMHIMEERNDIDENTGQPVTVQLKIEVTHPDANTLVIERAFVGNSDPVEKTVYTRF